MIVIRKNGGWLSDKSAKSYSSCLYMSLLAQCSGLWTIFECTCGCVVFDLISLLVWVSCWKGQGDGQPWYRVYSAQTSHIPEDWLPTASPHPECLSQHGVLDFSLHPRLPEHCSLWPLLPCEAISSMTSHQRVLKHREVWLLMTKITQWLY